MTSTESTKICTKCETVQPLTNFNRSTQNRDGYRGWCKSCQAEYHRQYRAQNKDAIRARQRQWEQDNPDKVRASRNKPEVKRRKRETDRRYNEANRERIQEVSRRWYEENRRDVIARACNWYQENKERKAEYDRQYGKENSLRRLAIGRAYRARKRDAQGSFTEDEWLELCEAYGNVCLCCGESKPLAADHVVPLSKGGSNDIGNIQPLCKVCNSSKNANIIDYR